MLDALAPLLDSPSLPRRRSTTSISWRSWVGINAANFFLAEVTGVTLPFIADYLQGRQWRPLAIGIALAVVGLGVGIPQSSGTGCFLTQFVQTGASSSPQLTVSVDAGSYCVRLHDTGTLTAPVSFSVTIVRP